MKKTKITVIFSAFILFAVFGFVANVNASGTSLYVSPASLTKNVGDTFSVSVGVSASDEKVFAAEGTLVFKGVTCKSITIASGLVPQMSPSCDNPHFLVGIPSGATVGKTLVTVTVTAGNAGNASVSLSGVDVIGEGKSLSTASSGGSYVIKSNEVIKDVKVIEKTTETPKTEAPKVTEKPVTASQTEEVITEDLVESSTTTTTASTSPEEELAVNDQEENQGRVLGESEQKGSNWYSSYILWIVIIILVIIIIAILMKRKK